METLPNLLIVNAHPPASIENLRANAFRWSRAPGTYEPQTPFGLRRGHAHCSLACFRTARPGSNAKSIAALLLLRFRDVSQQL